MIYSDDPSDTKGYNKHSYILNAHIIYADVRFNRWPKDEGVRREDIVIMGEKKTEYFDYYMEVNNWFSNPPQGDYDTRVETARHGVKLGSDLLFLDGSVNSRKLDKRPGFNIDPWQVSAKEGPKKPTTQKAG
jgi:hypothetical protein